MKPGCWSAARAVMVAVALALGPALTAPAQDVANLRLGFVGDIMAHDVNYRMADYRVIYQGVSDLFTGDDLTFANLELPVDATRPVSGYPLFSGSPAYVRAALDAGIDVLSLANNHAFDGGEEGIFQTLRSLASLQGAGRRFWVSGIRGNTWRDFGPTVIPLRGVRVGFIALTQFLNVPGGVRYVDMVDYGDPASVDRLLGAVRAARAAVDLLVVSWHGDTEYSTVPAPGKVGFFHRLLEAGAQIVFSHHPHVVQGYELAPTPGGTGVIMYSMGNFISGMTWGLDPAAPDPAWAATGEAYALRVSVRCAAGGCTVAGVRAIPVANYRDPQGSMVVGQLRELAAGALPVSEAWRRYFGRRLALMDSFLARMPLAPRPPG